MRYRSYFVLVLAFTITARWAHAQDPFARWQHFSATKSGGPIIRDPMKIYRLGNQYRADHDDQVHITNLENLSSVSLSEKNTCVEMPMPDGPAYPFDAHAVYKDFKLERSTVDSDDLIEGHKIKKESLTYTQIGNEAVFVKMTLYEAQDLDGFPIQIDVLPYIRKKPFTFHYSDVSVQTPDAALFTKPATCRAMAASAKDIAPKVPKAKTDPGSTKPAAKPAAKPPQPPPQ